MAENKIHPSLNQLPPFPSTVDRDGSFGSSSDHILPTSEAAVSPPSPVKKLEPEPALPPPPAYVFEFPKERILRYPPPENAKRFNHLSKKKPGRSGCRVCLCATIGALLFLIVAAAIAAGVLFLVYRPKAPDYAVTNLSIHRMNLTSSLLKSPEFEIAIRADNKKNKKIGIYYQSGSEVQVLYGGVPLAKGALPAFFQPSKNVTVFQTALTGSDVMLGNSVRVAMLSEQKNGRVPLQIKIKAPVKIKVGSAKTWKITVKVKCDVAVDALVEKANIVSSHCDYSARLW